MQTYCGQMRINDTVQYHVDKLRCTQYGRDQHRSSTQVYETDAIVKGVSSAKVIMIWAACVIIHLNKTL